MSFADEIEVSLDHALEQHPVMRRFESGEYKGASKREMITLLTSMIDLLISRDRDMAAAVLRIAEELDGLRSIQTARSPSRDGNERLSLRSRLEQDLERLAAAGHIPREGEREVRFRLDESGRIKWLEATRSQVPASALEAEQASGRRDERS